MLVPPLPEDEARQVRLEKTVNIDSIPEMDVIPDDLALPVLLKVGNDISTDDLVPAGTRVLPFWSNIERVGDFVFETVDESYPRRARESRPSGGHAIVAGNNYGQGSSRENAALAPRHLGLRVVLARSFARIHWQNLANFGVLPLTFTDPGDYDALAQGDMVRLSGLHAALRSGNPLLEASVKAGQGAERRVALCHDLSPRQVDLLLAGGVINWLRQRLAA
jgi:aconitate hydratase